MTDGIVSVHFDFTAMLDQLRSTGRPDWCGICGDGIKHAKKRDDDSPLEDDPCRICGEVSAPSHYLCAPHQIAAEDALKPLLPTLYARMEAEFGAEVDQFISLGRLKQVSWWLRDASVMAKRWAEEAFDAQIENDEDFDLRLIKTGSEENHKKKQWGQTHWRLWSHDDKDWFVPHLSGYIERAIEQAVKDLPTQQVERQLVDAITGDEGTIEGAEIQDGAIEFVLGFLPSSTGLSKGGDELLRIRYDEDCRQWDWHGWEEVPSTWQFAPDLIPDWLQVVADRRAGTRERSAGDGRAGA